MLFAIFLGTQVAITLAHFTARKYKEQVVPLVVRSAIAGIIGGRLWQVLFFTPPYYFAHPVQMLTIWNGGLAIQGGLVGGVVFGIYYVPKSRFRFGRWPIFWLPP